MPVIINDFEVVVDEAPARSPRQAQPEPSSTRDDTSRTPSLARRLRMLQARRARVHAD